MHEAMLYERLSDKRVRCALCAHRCTIGEGKKGICHVRSNVEGTLYTEVYGRVIAEHIDPIEKKPFYHFHPGSLSLSVATAGCNFTCGWCQNCEISQMPRDRRVILGSPLSPDDAVRAAVEGRCSSISYTYTEPTIFFEYSYDIAKPAHEAGIANNYVTNGYMTPEMLEKFHPLMDAATVDLKAFRDETYRKHIGARLEPVLESLRILKKQGVWVEVTTLIIPGLNDDPGELKELAEFLATEIGPETPWHISRFFPAYRMANTPPTPIGTLHRAREIGFEAGLRYVYCGNVSEDASTRCHSCEEVLITRNRYTVSENSVKSDGTCPNCGTPVAGVGMSGG